MTGKERVMTLPDKEEMLKRLIAVDDNDHLKERFYPSLLGHASSAKVAVGICMIINCAIYDYCEGMPEIMLAIMFMKAPAHIDALCDDKEIAEEAKAFLKEAIGL